MTCEAAHHRWRAAFDEDHLASSVLPSATVYEALAVPSLLELARQDARLLQVHTVRLL